MESAPDPEAPLDESGEPRGTSPSSAGSSSISFPAQACPYVHGRSISNTLDSVPAVIRSITDPGAVSWNLSAPPWASLPVSFRDRRSATLPSRRHGSDQWPVGFGGRLDTPSIYSDLGRAKGFLGRTHATSLLWAAEVERTLSRTLTRHGIHARPSAVVPMQRCNICLESVPDELCLVPKACGRQTHSTCKECMAMYVSLRIEEGRVTELWCPCAGSDGCQAKIADSEIEAWMTESIASKYHRFMRMHGDSSLRSCPGCNELCKPERQDPEEASSPIVPEMTCGSCGCQFCYYHSNAHEVGPKACAEHEREILKQERKALAKINTHKCPRCGVLTEKVSGCNHITCQCTCNWCWVCGKEITNVGWHYHPLKPFSCAQYNEKTAPRDQIRLTALMTLTKILTWPSAIIAAVFIFLGPFAFFAAVLAQVVLLGAICGCCMAFCICFKDADPEDFIKLVLSVALVFTFLTVGIPFLGFWLAWCFVALPLWLLLLPLGARCEHFMVLSCAPVMTVLASMECFAPEHE